MRRLREAPKASHDGPPRESHAEVELNSNRKVQSWVVKRRKRSCGHQVGPGRLCEQEDDQSENHEGESRGNDPVERLNRYRALGYKRPRCEDTNQREHGDENRIGVNGSPENRIRNLCRCATEHRPQESRPTDLCEGDYGEENQRDPTETENAPKNRVLLDTVAAADYRGGEQHNDDTGDVSDDHGENSWTKADKIRGCATDQERPCGDSETDVHPGEVAESPDALVLENGK